MKLFLCLFRVAPISLKHSKLERKRNFQVEALMGAGTMLHVASVAHIVCVWEEGGGGPPAGLHG